MCWYSMQLKSEHFTQNAAKGLTEAAKLINNQMTDQNNILIKKADHICYYVQKWKLYEAYKINGEINVDFLSQSETEHIEVCDDKLANKIYQYAQ